MGGMDAKPPTGHAFSGWWKRYGKEHPEWFALREDGTRGNPDPDATDVPMCVTNEELQDFVVEQWDGKSVLRLGPVDRPGRCTCGRCRAWDGPQPEDPARIRGVDLRNRSARGGTLSRRNIGPVCAVLEDDSRESGQEQSGRGRLRIVYLRKRIPRSASRYPLGTALLRRIRTMAGPAPEVVSHVGRGVRVDPAAVARLAEKRGSAWDTVPTTSTTGTSCRTSRRSNPAGSSSSPTSTGWKEHASTRSPASGPSTVQGFTCTCRLISNPELKLDDIRREYYSGFGPAAGAVQRYWEYWEEYANENQARFLELFRGIGWRYRAYPLCAHEAFPPECFEPAEALLSESMEAARKSPSPEYAQRVRFLQTGLEHARLTTKLTAVFAGNRRVPEERIADARQALTELVRFRKTHEETFFSDLCWVTNFWERPRLKLDGLMGSADGTK